MDILDQFDLNDVLSGLTKELDEIKKENAKKRIVAVDDDRNVLKLLRDVISKEYELTTMMNGKLLLKYFETKKADLILLDYEMPVMSGADALRKLRENEKTKNIPVIFLTGVSSVEKIREVLAFNPADYILKPINVERLRKDIKKILG